MAHTKVTKTHSQNTGTANTFSYSGSFDVFKGTEVVVLLDGIALTFTASTINESASPREYTVDPSAKTVHIGGADLSSGTITIRPETDLGSPTPRATYQPGASVTSDDLNNNQLQLMRKAMEYDETKLSTTGSSVMTGDLQLGQNVNITFEGSADDAHETTLTAANPTSDKTITLPDTTGTVVTTGDTGTVATAMIAGDAITGAKIADDQINSEHYVDGSIDTAHIADSQITSAKIVNGTIVADDLASDAVTTVKITDSNVTTAKIADTNVTTAKIANGAITTAKIAANAVTSTELANSAVNTARIAADAVTNAKIADDQIDSEHYVDGSIDTAHIGGAQVTDAKLASNSVTTSKITDGNVTTDKLAADSVTIAKIGCEQTTISNSDSHIPTSGAVVDYVAAQIAPIGGLEVIADEDNFPTSQPGSGVVISISDAAGIVVNGSGVSTTARTAGNGSDNVTINNFPSSLYGETLASGVGLMVSSTGSSNIYNYHKILAAETDVKQLSDDINDFNARYRVNAGEPGSNNDEGDLVYDTNANKMKVYDGSSWGEVTSTGDFKYLFLCPAGGSGAPTLNGSIATYDLRESSNSGSAASITSAAQLIVSINGVIQKANTGTSAPSEGFALVDSNTIVFGANLQTGDSVFIIQIGSAVTIPTPGDGTVAAAKIASGAVTTDKIADDAVTNAKIGDNAISTAKISNGQITGGKMANSAVGTTQLADSAVTTAKIADDAITQAKINIPLSNRNIIINGAMQISERATSASISGTGTTFVLDRWGIERSSAGTAVVTMSQDNQAPEGFSKSLKIDVTTADTSLAAGERWQVRTRIEAQNLKQLKYGTSNAKQMIISFFVRSNVTGTFTVGLYQADGSKVNSGNYTINSANTWEKKTVIINGNTSDAMTMDASLGIQIGFGIGSGTNFTSGTANGNWSSTNANQYAGQTNLLASTDNELFITGVQLEVGSVATNFEHRSYAQELALCQRYYIFNGANMGNAGKSYSMVSMDMPVTVNYGFPVQMRATPSVTTTNVNIRDDSNNSISANINSLSKFGHQYGVKKTGGQSEEYGISISDFKYDAEL